MVGVLAIAAAAAALVLHHSSGGGGPAAAFTPPPAPAAVAVAVAPRYTGPARLAPGGRLNGSVARPAGVAALTFEIDGHAVGTDATAPYGIRLVPGEVAPGDHRVRVVAVERSGARVASPPAPVHVAAAGGRVRVASPQQGLQAALAALSAGHATVRLLPGTYRDASVRLGPGSVLVGGEGVVLVAPAGSYTSVVSIAGDDAVVSSITIDGGGPGGGDGHAIDVGNAHRVVIRKVTAVRVRGDGVDVWGNSGDVTVQDSSFDGGGTAGAGVVAGLQNANDVSVVRTRIAHFRDFGINFVQPLFGFTENALRSLALDNVIADIRSPVDTEGRSQGGIWSGGAWATIVGNRISDTGWDGIETVGTSDHVVVARNVVAGTRTGIYLEHSTTNTLVSANVVRAVATGINVEWRYGGVGSSANVFSDNRIVQAGEHGIFIDAGSDGNLVLGNVVDAGSTAAIVLQGSSGNWVHQNVLCGTDRPAVVQQDALDDAGQTISSSSNRVGANTSTRRCPA